MKQRPPRKNTIDKDDIVDNYANVLRGRMGKEYLMLLDVLLCRDKATDWTGRTVKSEDAAVHHIFPREFLRENGETRDDMINCLANLTFIAPSANSEISDTPPAEYLPRYDKAVLEQHFIPTDGKVWNIDRYEDFLAKRFALIWKATKSLMEELEQEKAERPLPVGSLSR